MSCDFEAKLSLLMDGALSGDEASVVRQHVPQCESCRRAARDFGHLGRVIRNLDSATASSTEVALRAVLSAGKIGFWRRRVPVPLPLAAASALALVALGAWAAMGDVSSPEAARPATQALAGRPPATEPRGLDRFDRGQPARLYKVRRDAR